MKLTRGKKFLLFVGLAIAVPFTVSVVPKLVFAYRNFTGVYHERALNNLNNFAAKAPGNPTPVSCNAEDTDGNNYIGCTLANTNSVTQETSYTSVECSIRTFGGCELTDLQQLSGSGTVAIPQNIN